MSRMKQKCPEPRASPQVAVGRAERDPRPSRRALRGVRAGNRFRPRTVWALAIPPSAARPEADVGSSSRQGASPRGAPREPREGASASVLLTGRAWPRWFPKSRGQTGGRPGRRSWGARGPWCRSAPGWRGRFRGSAARRSPWGLSLHLQSAWPFPLPLVLARRQRPGSRGPPWRPLPFASCPAWGVRLLALEYHISFRYVVLFHYFLVFISASPVTLLTSL